MDSSARVIGTRQRRLEGGEKVSGRTLFTGDLSLPGLCHVRLVLSTEPAARILEVRKEAALAVPGVLAVLTSRDLKRAGIDASVRAVDAVQFEQRRLGYDFDMIWNRWDQSLSPGNEQSFYWGSAAADNPGTRNYMGAKDPAIDAMIAAMLEAREHPVFVSAVRALDRTLMSGFYAIPIFNAQEQWIARWNRIERPSATALTGYLPETWWQRPQPQPK